MSAATVPAPGGGPPVAPALDGWTVAAFALLAYSVYHAIHLSLRNAMGPDGGYYTVLSWEIGAGAVPYRDFWFMHTPGLLYAQRVYSALLGDSRAGLCATTWLQHAATLAFLLLVTRRLLRPSAAVLALVAAAYLRGIGRLEGFYYIVEPHLDALGWLSIALALLAPERPGRRGVAIAFAAGLAAGGAFWMKQHGLLFGALAAALPSLVAGRIRLKPAALVAAGIAVYPLGFCALHPDAAQAFLRMGVGDLARYAASNDKAALPWAFRSIAHSFVWVAGLIATGLATAALAARSADPERRRAGRVLLACLFTGALFLAPSFVKPYPHYFLVPLPFAALGLAAALTLAPLRLVHLAALALVALPFLPRPLTVNAILDAPVTVEPDGWRDEVDRGRFIAEHAGSAPNVYIVPNSPQYYVLARRLGIDRDYLFLPDDERALRSLASHAPAFIVDRGDGEVDLARYAALFRRAGYELSAEGARVSAWRYRPR